jgi:phosphoribosylaminoimidazole carboxylase PurE protein
MGSTSDWETMRHAAETLEALGVPYEKRVVSAHRTPRLMFEYASRAAARGLRVLIAGAGGAAHLPGMTASLTSLPVLGVPVESAALKGLDSLCSIVQMPGGHPGRDLRHRQARRGQRGPFRGLAPRPRRSRNRAGARGPPLRADAQGPRRPASVIGPGKAIGVLGGGQLGRMFAQAAQSLGYRVHVYEPLAQSPAGSVADRETVAPYDNLAALGEFARSVDVVTYEFENIPAEPLEAIAKLVVAPPGARGSCGPARTAGARRRG